MNKKKKKQTKKKEEKNRQNKAKPKNTLGNNYETDDRKEKERNVHVNAENRSFDL